MFAERYFSDSSFKQKVMSFGGQTSWAKMTSPRGKLTAAACHLTKKVNISDELTLGILKGEVSLYH
jgi:hypothetical protein